jgi:hypothetical protein
LFAREAAGYRHHMATTAGEIPSLLDEGRTSVRLYEKARLDIHVG